MVGVPNFDPYPNIYTKPMETRNGNLEIEGLPKKNFLFKPISEFPSTDWLCMDFDGLELYYAVFTSSWAWNLENHHEKTCRSQA